MFKNAVDVFDIMGFRVRIDPSWLLIAALVIWSLSRSYFPKALPGLTTYDYVALGTVSMLGLFASLILHELSHSITARFFNLKISSITLFIFGGVAELDQEPKSPRSEFWIAIAGPAMSFGLAGLCYFSVMFLTSFGVSAPLVSIFTYLALVNLILAAFNLIPAFPLDGGRIFRAVLWYIKSDLFGATKIASSMGSAFGFLLIVSGILSLFSASSIAGLWQILIGFFIVHASRNSYQQLIFSSALRGQTVRSLMTTSLMTARPEQSIQSVIDDTILKHNISFVPVVEGNHLLGFVSTSVLKTIEAENWNQTKIGDVFVACSNGNSISPSTSVETVFQKMLKEDQRKLMVVENGTLIGVISLADLTTFLSIRSGLGLLADHRQTDNPSPTGAAV